jgi:T-complex protein 1 subunit beta
LFACCRTESPHPIHSKSPDPLQKRREAESLINQRIHPQTIAEGWRLARKAARDALEASAIDNSADEAKFREDLLRIARTTLSSKLVTYDKDYFANLAVDAVMRLKGSNNLDHIQILKKPGGHLRDSYLEEGFLLDKKIGVGQPKRIEKARILLANTSMDTDKIKIYGSRVRVDSLNKVAEIEEAEKVRRLSCGWVSGRSPDRSRTLSTSTSSPPPPLHTHTHTNCLRITCAC